MVLWVEGEKRSTDDSEGIIVGTGCIMAANCTKKGREKATRFWAKMTEDVDMSQRRCWVGDSCNYVILHCKKGQDEIQKKREQKCSI